MSPLPLQPAPTPYSRTLDDLLAHFLRGLPQQIESIHLLLLQGQQQEWPATIFEQLYRLLVHLVGTAATYGLKRISQSGQQFMVQISCLEERQIGAITSAEQALLELEEALTETIQLTLPLSESLHFNYSGEALNTPTILLFADLAPQIHRIERLLAQQGCRVHSSNSQLLGSSRPLPPLQPNLILLDQITQPPADIPDRVTRLRQFYSEPLLILSAPASIEQKLAIYRAGASRILTTPFNDEDLTYTIDALCRRLPVDGYQIVVIDDSPTTDPALITLLRQASLRVRVIQQPLKALEIIRICHPDLLLIKLNMVAVSGHELTALIRDDRRFEQLPILLMGEKDPGYHPPPEQLLGGDEVILQPYNPTALYDLILNYARRYRQSQQRRLALEQGRMELQNEHRALNEHAIVSITDRSGTILYANDRFCQISGYPRHELIGHTHRILKSDRHSPEFYQKLWQTISSGSVWQGEICNRNRLGELYWVESTIVPFLSPSGQVVQYISIRTDISRVKRLEMEALVNSERLRRSQIFANIGTWDWNIITGELFWSDRIAPLFGYPAGEQESSYASFLNAIHPADREAVILAINNCIAEGAEYNIEHRVVWPDGSLHWVQEKGDVVRDAHGEPQHMLGVVIDIHDRKMAEEAQQESESRFRNLFELSPVGIALNSVEGTFMEANQALLDATGYNRKQLCELSYWALTPPEYSAKEAEQLHQLHTSGHYGPYEKEYIHHDGHRLPVLVHGVLVRNRHGTPQIWSIIQDMTHIKKAERHLALFRQIFESTAQGIGVTDAKGYLLYSNRAHDEIHGYTQEEVIGRHFSSFLSKETLEWAPAALMAALHAGESWSGLLPIQRPDGEVIITQANVGAINTADGAPEYFFNIMNDYTPELQRQEQLAHAKEIAEAANRAKSAFLANMSHEIRTPMNAIIGMTELALDSPLSPDQRKQLQAVAGASKSLLSLLNDILDFSKLEGGKMELEQIDFNLRQILDEIHSLVNHTATAKGLSFHYQLEEPLPSWVKGDPTRLRQVLLNLIGNAIKFTQHGGIRVQLAAGTHPDEYHFSVIDSGIGIAAHRLDHIFERFSQADQSTTRRFGGTGLGTTISRELVERMGGQIWAESVEGEGSEFHFTVYLPRGQAGSESLFNLNHRPATPLPPIRPLQILLVEDIPLNRDLMVQRLQQRHHQVVTAENGQQALEAAAVQRFDLILMDVMMPVMDGLTATQRLRQIETATGQPHTPIFILSASVMHEEQQRCLAAGADEFIAKPVDFTLLFQQFAHYYPSSERNTPPSLERSLPPHQLSSGAQIWGSEAAYCKALTTFIRDSIHYTDDLCAAFQQQNWQQLTEIIHKFKGVAAHLALQNLVTLLIEVEALLHSSPPPQTVLESLLDTVITELKQIQSYPFPTESPPSSAPPSLSELGQFDRSVVIPLLRQLETTLRHSEVNEPILQQLQPIAAAAMAPIEQLIDEFELERAAAAVAELLQALNLLEHSRSTQQHE